MILVNRKAKVGEQLYSKLAYLLLFTILILFGLNTHNADMKNYISVYEHIYTYGSYIDIDIGFEFLMKLVARITSNYQIFLSLYSILCVILLSNYLLRVCNSYKSICIVLLLYFIYPYILDTVQLRFYLASLIVLNATLLLGEEMNLFENTKFIILVVFASLFHKIAIIYIILLMIQIKKNNLFFPMIFFTVLTSLIIFPLFLDGILIKLNFQKYLLYLGNPESIFIIIFFLLYFLGQAFMVWLIDVSSQKYFNSIASLITYLKSNSLKQHLENTSSEGKKLIKINLVMLATLPMIFITIDFYRIQRSMLLLNYVFFSNFLVSMPNKKSRFHKFLKYSIVIFVFLSGYAFIFRSMFDILVVDIFKHNLIVEMFFK